ncbi:MAG: CsgG/HfaB family protein [Kiritimatiellae bacterium]|nr:CsgG/HfaB family protein [Kiritimatiellia bacterium]
MNRPLRCYLRSLLMLGLGAATARAQIGVPPARTRDGTSKPALGEYKGVKHAIGCKDFRNESGWRGHWEIGYNLTIMLESALRDTGRFVLVEREQLGDVLLEQDLAASGRAAASQVARKGLIRPARYIATGAITEVSEGQSGLGGGISVGGIRLGGTRAEAQLAVIVKLVDTTTGEIVAQQRVVGKAGRTGLNVGLSVGRVSTDLGGFVKTPLGQAAQDCINQAAAFIAKKMEEFPVEGSVIKTADDGRVIINRGAEYGVQVGHELVMVRPGEVLIDPDSGAVLERAAGKTIGRLKVVEVTDKVAYCEVLEGERKPETGVTVQLKPAR